MIKAVRLAVILSVFISCQSSPTLEWTSTRQPANTTALLQAIHIVDSSTVWVSGHDGTFGYTTNGGKQWNFYQHPTADTLQFRDVHAFDSSKVLLMSAGPGKLSRIFSVERNVIWREHFVMKDSLGFLDCMDFWDDSRGLAYGDSFDGYPYLLKTTNGGRNWKRIPVTTLPKALSGEGGFAASGTCVETASGGKAWVATGGGNGARLLYTSDYGESWQTIKTGMKGGEAAGHTSITVADEVAFAVGGNLQTNNQRNSRTFISMDQGQNWSATTPPPIEGALYGSAIAPYHGRHVLLACGPKGLVASDDYGKTWTSADTASYWATAIHESGRGWAVGPNGKILQFKLNN